MNFDGFRHTLLNGQLPKWLTDRPLFRNGYKLLYTFAAQLDLFVEQAVEGVYAAWPGYGTPTALPLIGQTRGIVRGEGDTDLTYAARLRDWFAMWQDMGSDDVLAREIQRYLGNTPSVRIVDRSGNWTCLDPSGVITRYDAGTSAFVWNWDGTSNPERTGPDPWWSDIWIVVEPCEWEVTGGTVGGGGLAAIWGGAGGDVGVGHAVPTIAHDAILGIVRQCKGAHTFVQAIVWSYDADFDPSTTSAYNPDGTWGDWGYDGGAGLQQRRYPGRGIRARYWTPEA